MPSANITAVVSFCSNDWRFLKRCIEGVSPVCRHTYVTVCDHFFDGAEENYALLLEAFERFPDCTFLVFHYDPVQSYRSYSTLDPAHPHFRHEWHNTGRWLGYLYSDPDADFLFFLDCDEIVETQKFSQWLQSADLELHAAFRFASYWHFREAQFVATAQDDSSLFVKREKLRAAWLWDEDERCGLFHRMEGQKQLNVRGEGGEPMIRHYMGVRTQEELSKKLKAWGHYWERDWEKLLKNEYSRPFTGVDFIRRYTYEATEVDFDPLTVEVPAPAPVERSEFLKRLPQFRNVIDVSKQDAFRRELEDEFRLFDCDDHQLLQQ